MFGDPPVNVNAYNIYRCSGKYENKGIPLPQIPTKNINAPWNLVAEPLLSCYHWVYGPVGLYWVLPLLLAMYVDEKTWHVEASDLACDEQTGSAHLCPGLPKKCHTSVHRLSQEEWVKTYDLHRLFMSYQCDTLTRCVQNPGQRTASSLSLLYPPKSDILESQKFLYIAVTAGIVLASAIVDEKIADEWEVVLLCSATRSGGGTLLMTHLQKEAPSRQGPRLKLSPVKGAIEFYQRLGFHWHENNCTHMYWPIVPSQQIGPLRPRSSSARTHPYTREVIDIGSDSD